MINTAIEVRMAKGREVLAMEADDPRRAEGGGSLMTPTPVRPGIVNELSDFRALVYSRFEEIDQQLVSLRQRVSVLESHVFGDGPQAVSGR